MNRIDDKKKVSIIISAYNEEGNIVELYNKINVLIDEIESCEFEIIFVNDGSIDRTFYEISSLFVNNHKIKFINLTRNFGHEVAMTAGMHYSRGDCVIFMDADLQHPPEIIREMIELWLAGTDVVLTKRVNMHGKGFVNRILGKLFYKFLNLLSDIKIPENAPDFRLIDKKYVNILRQMDEREIMFRGMLNWLGIQNCKTIEFEAPDRYRGKTKYNFRSLFRLGINSIIQFSIKPLRLATYVGLLTALVSIVIGGFTVWEYFTFDKPDTGFTTIIVTIVFLGSIQLIVCGIIGEYIGRIHLETKKRPLYVATYYSHDEDDEVAAKDMVLSDNMLKSMEENNNHTKKNDVMDNHN